jgi:hypothetical protein
VLTVSRFIPGSIRITRVSCGIECAHPISIKRITRKSRIGITAGVGGHFSYLHKVCAIVALAALDAETVLVS